jgi:hypothetical protein
MNNAGAILGDMRLVVMAAWAAIEPRIQPLADTAFAPEEAVADMGVVEKAMGVKMSAHRSKC